MASNANRLGASFFNDSSAPCYVRLEAAAASSTNYTTKVFTNGYYELPAGYTGEVRGIWATDPGDGGMKVTEYT